MSKHIWKKALPALLMSSTVGSLVGSCCCCFSCVTFVTDVKSGFSGGTVEIASGEVSVSPSRGNLPVGISSEI